MGLGILPSHNIFAFTYSKKATTFVALAMYSHTYNVGGEDAESYGIVLDSYRNVYVTGRSYADGHDNNVLTIKYDENGNFVWQSSYDRIGGSDRAECIALDSTGHLFVSGRSYYRTPENSDYLLMKYDANGGSILWSKSYDSQTGEDWAYGIAIDQYDNLYVVGNSFDAAKMTTVKFSHVVEE
jgi:beta-propeller repeat-containing protein